MKKIFPILLCVLLIGALALSVSAEGSSVALTSSKTTLERGDTFTVVANLTNTDAINLCTVALSFNTNVFELVDGSYLESAAYGDVKMEGQIAAGSFVLGKATKVSGQIFTFNFKVKDDAALGTYAITPTVSIGANAQIPATATKVTVACKHSYSEWTDLENGKHSRTCSKCQNVQTEGHDWNDGAPTPAATCDTPGTMKYKCLFCSATKTEDIKALGHKFSNDCDTSCNRSGCKYTRTASHKITTSWSSDKNGHWHMCTVCKATIDYAAHTPNATVNEGDAKICTVCQYEISPAVAHEHEMSEEWITDAQYHWRRCQKKNPTCYHTADKAEHDYDNDCDVSCNTCAYIREAPHNNTGEWKAGPDGHWYVCTACGVKSQVYAHESGPEATQETAQICVECNFVIKLPLSHVHEFGEVWYDDEEYHWQSCTDSACFETTQMEPHAWDEGVELEDGSLQYVCTVCDKTIVTTTPIPEPTEPAPSNPGSVPGEQGSEDQHSGGFPWQWAGIAAVVLLVIGIVLLVIEFIRSRKVNSHGRFSK